MEGYGMAKSAVHQIVQSMGKESSVMPRVLKKQSFLGILPSVIDTPANRNDMPTANHTKWTAPEAIADELVNWIKMPYLRPATGNLVKVVSNNMKGKTMFVLSR